MKILIAASTIDYPIQNGGMMRTLYPILEIGKDNQFQFSFLFYKNNLELREKVIRALLETQGVLEAVAVNQRWLGWEQTLDVLECEDVPLEVFHRISQEYEHALITMLKRYRYDIVQIEQSYMCWIIPLIRQYSSHTKIVLNLHNAEYLIWKRRFEHSEESDLKRKISELVWHKTEIWEKNIWKQVDYCMAVSEVEADLFRQEAPLVPVMALPVCGMDTNHYRFKPYRGNKEYDIVFVGSLSWYPNYQGLAWFIKTVMPLIQKKKPDVRLHIIGVGTPHKSLCEIINNRKDIAFWGMQEDERTFLYQGSVFIVPQWVAAGARVKILTAWACGIPIVATSIGAEGQVYTHGENILIGDQPEVMAAQVIAVLESPELGKKLSFNGRKLVEERYSLQYTSEKQKEIYVSLAGEK